MLTRFCVSNFKKFDDTLELDLSSPASYEFNDVAIQGGVVSKGLIYGKNDSGKSCLCLALFDITRHLTDNEKLPDDTYYPVINLDTGAATADFEYDFLFGGKAVIYRYSKDSHMELTRESLTIDGREVIRYDFGDGTGFVRLKGAETLRLESNVSKISRVKYVKANTMLDRDDEDNKAFKAFLDFVDRMLLFYSLRANRYQGLCYVKGDNVTEAITAGGKTKDFEKFLRRHGIDLDLTERYTYDGHKGIFVHFRETGNDVEFWHLASHGIQSLTLFYYWFHVQEKKPSLIVIDEFDVFYHFALAEEIVETMRDMSDTQIFLTTHNTDLMSNDLLRPDCYFILKDGKITSLNNLTRKDIRLANNLQKMFKAGFFDE